LSPSHCIGAGCDSAEVNGIWYYAPKFCILGNPRPSPAGTNPDIGACESLFGTPIVGVEEEIIPPSNFILEQNYPNPFNPSTKISWQSPISSRQVLKVYDVLGNEVATLVNEEKEAGYHSIDFNASGLSSGIYYYQLSTNNSTLTKKMILTK
jgi:hypothetical protein